MSDPFTEITDQLKQEGMSMEDTTLTAVQHQAVIAATYYLTLRHNDIKPGHCLDLTHHWLDLCSGVESEDEGDE